MNKILRLILISATALLAILLVAAMCCFTKLDSRPYLRTWFYKSEIKIVDSLKRNALIAPEDTEAVEVGWARVNLLPPFTTPIAIDAHRGGKHYEGVHDSIYVRAFVFKQGGKKVAYVSADLLIIPPIVTHIFDSLLLKEGFDNSNIYFTATHTHTSIGGWHNSYVGKLFAGKFNPKVPRHIAKCIAQAIKLAEQNCAPAKMGYASIPASKLVFNRLVREKGKVDSMLSIIKIEKETGEKAAIITFAAHATVFHENLMQLSGDWPGLMMKKLNESGKMNFASFSAGAVGSHGPYEETKNQEDEAAYMAEKVATLVEENFDSIHTESIHELNMMHVPLKLRQPQMRVTNQIVLKPWLFRKLFGSAPVYINTLQLGDIYFAGTPCDFSGELIDPLDSTALQNKLNLVVTSFNGGYIGYITDSKWYGMNAYETRTMGWFGPGNGDYMSETLMRLMQRNETVKQGPAL
jgi:neutral ceramidase